MTNARHHHQPTERKCYTLPVFERAQETSCRGHQAFLAALLLAAFVLLTGCGAGMPEPEVDEAAIEEVVRSYLPAISEAYKNGNVIPLQALAVPKEVERVKLRRSELEDIGRVFEPEFKDLVVENVAIWKYSNAVVTTVEVWDIRSYALGSHTLLQEVIDQRSRVKYQLKRKDEGWKIIYRELAETLSDP